MRIALTMAYDGREFDGWQTQPSGNTVQDQLQEALATLAGSPVPTICAGRTDAGVHGLGQVVHFDVSVDRPISAWVRGVNSHLPDSIAVLTAQVVRDDFHARFDAIERCYRYYLTHSPVRHPLTVGRAGWVHRALDIAKIREAAQSLVGTHDFSSFRSSQCQAKSPVRTINRIDVSQVGEMICVRISANAYLQHMIRNIVGLLVMIGDARQPVQWAAHVLESLDRSVSAPTFAPDGLYFESVRYPQHDSIPTPGLNDGVTQAFMQ